MRRLVKLLHTIGAAGLMGAAAALIVVLISAPASFTAGEYGPVLTAVAKIAAWIIGPSMVLTVVSGLLSMAVHPPFRDAGWAWVKTATGLLILQATAHLLGALDEATKEGAGDSDLASAARLLEGEVNTLWVLLGVSAANVALGIWRPRLMKFSR